MENEPEDKHVLSVRIIKKPEPQSEPTLLFSQQDIRKFVTEFVASWIRGEITIRFPTAAPLVKDELKVKEHYIDQLSIVAGIKPASADDQEKAIAQVFKMLLIFRLANLIEGKISSNDLEKRVQELEETIKKQNKLLEHITGFLFKPKPSNKKSTVAKS